MERLVSSQILKAVHGLLLEKLADCHTESLNFSDQAINNRLVGLRRASADKRKNNLEVALLIIGVGSILAEILAQLDELIDNAGK
jgi:hypothetical protein